jgi:hypothetical protein
MVRRVYFGMYLAERLRLDSDAGYSDGQDVTLKTRWIVCDKIVTFGAIYKYGHLLVVGD